MFFQSGTQNNDKNYSGTTTAYCLAQGPKLYNFLPLYIKLVRLSFSVNIALA